jgi:glutathione S-transferase
MAKVILHGPKYSTYTRTARLALEEKGAAYDLAEVDIFKGVGQEAKHIARHPYGKVPVFEQDGMEIFETGAILRYIDETIPGPKLQPEDPRQRARMNQIMAILDNYTFKPVVVDIVVQRVVKPMLGQPTDEKIITDAIPLAKKALGAIANLMGKNPYLAGDKISLADLLLAPMMAYFSQTPEGSKMLGELPSLKTWWDKISTRPSVVKTA